jgi:hypothetical protein
MELQPEGAGCRLQVFCGGLGEIRTGRIDEQRNDGHRGDQLVQQLQPLRPYLYVQRGYACEVAARPIGSFRPPPNPITWLQVSER